MSATHSQSLGDQHLSRVPWFEKRGAVLNRYQNRTDDHFIDLEFGIRKNRFGIILKCIIILKWTTICRTTVNNYLNLRQFDNNVT